MLPSFVFAECMNWPEAVVKAVSLVAFLIFVGFMTWVFFRD
jgi:hypothetical protein